MASAQPNTYDQLPYLSRPRRNCHPDTYATVARLMGMEPAPVDNCRVLEIGCSTGGNLTPLAMSLPNSEFVGIDLSSVQIAMAKKMAADLGVDNVAYEAMSLTDLTPEHGQFDYIICHGVYSWVPEFVQQKIFEVCSKNLSPQGVAYISYNTYPGWHLRMPAREIMLYFLRRVKDPAHRTEAARSFFNFVVENNPFPDSVYGRLMSQEAKLLSDHEDYYLAHEHLDSDNRPCYFYEFMEQASKYHLQYLGNSEPEYQLRELPEQARTVLPQTAQTLVELEQYIDMIMGRTFRRSLLCHADVKLNRAPETETVFSLLATSAAKPVNDAPNHKHPQVEKFHNPRGNELSTGNAITRAIYWKLWDEAPQPVPVPQLVPFLDDVLGPDWAASDKAKRDTVAATLLEGYLNLAVSLQTHIPAFVTTISDKPETTRLARYWVRQFPTAPSLRHQEVPLTNLQRFLLAHCTGELTRAELIDGLQQAASAKLIDEPAEGWDAAYDEALRLFKNSALLIG